MQNSTTVQQNNTIAMPSNDKGSYLAFLNDVEYKGEHCFSCGHTWKEKGELHFKHCRFFVSSHLHTPKRH